MPSEINTGAVPALTYSMGIIKWSDEDLNQLVSLRIRDEVQKASGKSLSGKSICPEI